jgi:NAD(P)-dependent dehydrogenase (short-subunit alcohol dehydrogenase family)
VTTALVTGVSHSLGPGFAAARRLAEDGYHVIVGGPLRAQTELLSARLRAAGFTASPLRLDLDDVDSFPAVAADLRQRFGHLDAVVNTVESAGATQLAAALRGLLAAES